MAVVYLKKRKMLEIACNILKLDCDIKLKDCNYRFYRGTEWLRFCDNSYNYDICAMRGGAYLSVTTFVYDEQLSRQVQVSFKVLNGCGKREVIL